MALVRGMRLKELGDALVETAKLSIMIFTIIWGVLIYVRFLGFADFPAPSPTGSHRCSTRR